MKRCAEESERFVVGFQRHRKRVSILAAVRERKPRRVGEPAGRAMDDFGDERKRLQSAWAEILEQQKFSELMQIAFIRDGEHCAETFQVEVPRANVVMIRHRSEEHTSELQSQSNLVCRLLLEKKKQQQKIHKHKTITIFSDHSV